MKSIMTSSVIPTELQRHISTEFYKARFTIKETRKALPNDLVSTTSIQQAFYNAKHNNVAKYSITEIPDLQKLYDEFIEKAKACLINYVENY